MCYDAWVETYLIFQDKLDLSRTPHGMRGLKLKVQHENAVKSGAHPTQGCRD